jgi:hypothetical protein
MSDGLSLNVLYTLHLPKFQMKELVKSLESKVTELETKVQRQDSLLTSLLREKNDRAVAADCMSQLALINQQWP